MYEIKSVENKHIEKVKASKIIEKEDEEKE